MADLYDYQQEDAEKIALGDMGAWLLANDAGTGKTATLVAASCLFAAGTHSGAVLVVVACPAVARGVWAQEWKRWAGPAWRILRINKGEEIPKIAALDMSQPNVVIVSYDLFSRLEGPKGKKVSPVVETIATLKPEFSVVISDECHFLKGLTSNRTVAVYDLAARLDARMWLASATPAPNHYGEMYPAILNLWPEELTKRGILNQEQFEDRFCNVKEMWINGRMMRTISGSKNGKELKDLLTPHMIRRKKSEVLSELPPMTFDTLPLDANPIVTTVLENLSRNLGTQSDDDLLSSVSGMSTHIATERRELGLSKVAQCIEWIVEFLAPDPTKKIVVFAYHKEVIRSLFDALTEYSPVVIDGRSSAKDRDDAVHAFQNAGARVFIGQIIAAGTAITLTAASDVLFVESDWTPSNNYQAASRCHRIGQRDNVIVRHAVLEGSLDERIARALIRKEAELAEIFG